MIAPMRRIRSGCCARVASGHAAAVLPSTPRNSRRLMFYLLRRRLRIGEDYTTKEETGIDLGHGLLRDRPMSQMGHGETNSAQSFFVRSTFNNGRPVAPQYPPASCQLRTSTALQQSGL
jgi:hypothetical protein